MAKTCDHPDCDQPRATQRRWCNKHYFRQYRNGDMDSDRRRVAKQRLTHSDGYVILVLPTHVLADGSGHVFEHRKVLFDRIGFGPHLCHWCGGALSWRAGLQADHVDFDRANNDPANLVESCKSCNTRRALERRWAS